MCQGGIYEVVKQLPSNGEFEYLSRAASEPHERVVAAVTLD
jgi:hypothetical protein